MKKFNIIDGYTTLNQWNTYHYVNPQDTKNVWPPSIHEDCMDRFWEWILHKPPYSDLHRAHALSTIKWLLDNRMHFLIEPTTTDIIDYHEVTQDRPVEEWAYTEMASWKLIIPNDDDAMIFKLTWGDK